MNSVLPKLVDNRVSTIDLGGSEIIIEYEEVWGTLYTKNTDAKRGIGIMA